MKIKIYLQKCKKIVKIIASFTQLVESGTQKGENITNENKLCI